MSGHSQLTVCLLNYKRPENLPIIVAKLREQTIEPKLFLWNNGCDRVDVQVDWVVHSSCNRQCWPRWFLAAHAETEFVAVLDDDLCPVDQTLFREFVDHLKNHGDSRVIIGPYGVVLDSRYSYRACSRTRVSGDEVIAADIIKGRLMVMRTAEVRRLLPLIGATSLHDDIVVSGIFAEGRKRPHLWARGTKSKLREMPEPDAVWKRSSHYREREEARRIYFP